MDGGTVIRATSSFRLGASGGGAFDDAGNLVGVITLKSKGQDAFYYYMPVEWVQALMRQPAQAVSAKSEQPFWAAAEKPYFMQVATPHQKRDWNKLLKVAQTWAEREPDTAESWFYLALAEYATQDLESAAAHFRKALALDAQHIEAADYLKRIAQTSSQNVALLDTY